MVACISPKTSMLIATGFWILLPICYGIMKRGDHFTEEPSTFKTVTYTALNDSRGSGSNQSTVTLSIRYKLILTWETMPLFIGLFTRVFCRQLIITSVVTTISFSSLWATPRTQYLLYVLGYGTGEFLGRSYLMFLSVCGLEKYFVVRKTWLLTFMNVVFLNGFVLVSWCRYGFLNNSFVVFGMIFINSVCSGIVFTCNLLQAGEDKQEVEKKFCRAILCCIISLGAVVVSLLGLDLEYQLRVHCLQTLPLSDCYTRSMTAWNASNACTL